MTNTTKNKGSWEWVDTLVYALCASYAILWALAQLCPQVTITMRNYFAILILWRCIKMEKQWMKKEN